MSKNQSISLHETTNLNSFFNSAMHLHFGLFDKITREGSLMNKDSRMFPFFRKLLRGSTVPTIA